MEVEETILGELLNEIRRGGNRCEVKRGGLGLETLSEQTMLLAMTSVFCFCLCFLSMVFLLFLLNRGAGDGLTGRSGGPGNMICKLYRLTHVLGDSLEVFVCPLVRAAGGALGFKSFKESGRERAFEVGVPLTHVAFGLVLARSILWHYECKRWRVLAKFMHTSRGGTYSQTEWVNSF